MSFDEKRYPSDVMFDIMPVTLAFPTLFAVLGLVGPTQQFCPEKRKGGNGRYRKQPYTSSVELRHVT